MTRRTAALLILLVLALAAAYGSSSERADPPVGAPSTLPEPPTTPISWSSVGVHDLGEGWSLRDAEGDGPFIDVFLHDRRVGSIELVSFPLESLGEEVVTLRAHVEDFVDTLRDDRRAGCGPRYPFEATPVVELDLPDGEAVRYGFRGGRPGRQERSLQWAGIRGERLVIISVNAYDSLGCLGSEGGDMDVATLDALERRLAPAVERSPLPELS
jgi:hypothetical protein